ncbi:IPT/TIG domain-containing protein [Hymenobacter rubidus]|uniref:IPT/TIG domain-containing protein n=1 Tax=Hymenobacter rubidus TaxID=1441626 RepID=UPI00191F5BDD|nr:IPT/TIG domain-containing protein [Hymenobacter rubidus]
MKHFFTSRLLACLVMLALLCPALAGYAQNITQADFTGVVVPQYLSSGNNSTTTTNPGPRLAYVFRGTLTNLTPSTLYRYFVLAATSTDFGTTGAAGVVLSLTPGTTPATSTYVTTSTGSLSTAGSYATFTTDASGNYTGWFGFVNSTNARFTTSGNVLYPMITLATDATPATIVARRALDLGATVLAFGTGANTGTLLTGSSSATPKNLVFTYDNTTGTGRPVSGGLVEGVGVATGTIATYGTTDGSYSVIIPGTLGNGVRRVEERSIVTGAVLNCNNDADGLWPSGANTVSPTGGATPVVLTATDTPLNAGCASATTATITAAPATLTAFSTVVGTASATQTITVGGSSLTAGIVVTAPAGYEVSLSATSGFAASLTVPQTGGTAASTPVYVRLTGAATGTFAGNVALTSTGAAAVNVAVTGTVTTAATPAPTVTSFTPTSGPVGTTVTVTGTNFTGATGATLNGLAGTNFMVMSATSVMFDVPTGATSGPIAVTTPAGTGTSAGTFTVTLPVVAPTISALTPNAQVLGGPAVTLVITGTGFTPTSTVSFNGVTYQQTSSTATSLTVTIPASAVATAGSYPVTVTNTAGTSTVLTFIVSNPSTAGAFEDFETGTKTTYAAASVALASGSWTFSDALIGTSFADKFNGLKSARIRAGFIRMDFDKTTGAGTVIVNAALYGTDTGATFILEKSTDGGATFTTVPGAPATLTATLTPYTFAVNQGGNVRFRITNTTTATVRVIVDDISISNYTAPANPVPTITSITPNSVVVGNTGNVTLVGTGFTSASTVVVNGASIPATVIPSTFVSATQITATVPAGAPEGAYTVTVVNPTPGGGTSNGVAFTIVPPAPTITSFTPTTGGPGTGVTVTGTNLLNASAVRIGSFNVPNYSVVSATSITFVVPGGTGSVSGRITVVTPGGTATSTASFNLVSATLAGQALPGLSVFPNPAADRITISLPTAGAAMVALRDLAGRVVLAPAVLGADKQLVLPATLARGIYLLEVRQGDVTAVRRIEKN